MYGAFSQRHSSTWDYIWVLRFPSSPTNVPCFILRRTNVALSLVVIVVVVNKFHTDAVCLTVRNFRQKLFTEPWICVERKLGYRSRSTKILPNMNNKYNTREVVENELEKQHGICILQRTTYNQWMKWHGIRVLLWTMVFYRVCSLYTFAYANNEHIKCACECVCVRCQSSAPIHIGCVHNVYKRDNRNEFANTEHVPHKLFGFCNHIIRFGPTWI